MRCVLRTIEANRIVDITSVAAIGGGSRLGTCRPRSGGWRTSPPRRSSRRRRWCVVAAPRAHRLIALFPDASDRRASANDCRQARRAGAHASAERRRGARLCRRPARQAACAARDDNDADGDAIDDWRIDDDSDSADNDDGQADDRRAERTRRRRAGIDGVSERRVSLWRHP